VLLVPLLPPDELPVPPPAELTLPPAPPAPLVEPSSNATDVGAGL
jgi:hypothetical protein